jgi:hypothetical protein
MESSGEKLLFTDIDHILTEELIHHVRATNYDIVYFKREAAVLDENGKLTQDHKILREYGLTEKWFERNLDLGAHGSSYAIKRDIYFKLGGQDENAIMIHPNRENVKLRYRIRKAITNSEIYASPVFPMIYCIPNGHFCGDRNYNPKNLFHSLKRNTVYS